MGLPMQSILEDRPDQIPRKEAQQRLYEGRLGERQDAREGQRRVRPQVRERRRELERRAEEEVYCDRAPDDRHDVPVGARECLCPMTCGVMCEGFMII